MDSSTILHRAVVGFALSALLVLSGAAAAAASSTHDKPARSVVSTTAGPAHAARKIHRFRGTVTATSRSHRWFRMRSTTHRSLRIHTSDSTWWDDCDWGSMSYGHHVDVRAYRSHGMWFASSMHNWNDSGDWGDMWMD